MNKKYRKMIEQIKLDAEAYTEEEMEPVYKAQKAELDALEVLLGALFIKYSIDGFLKMTSKQKADAGIKSVLKNMGKKLGNVEVDKTTSILSNVFKETYYKNAFVMQSGLDVEIKFDILKKEFIDSAVNAKYKGEFFSDRIWTNKADMIDKLQSSLTDVMNGKTTIDKVAKDIKETFNVSAYNSRRLVNTEMARCQADASNGIANSLGIKRHIWDATLDNLTNPEDASYDGNIYDIDDDSAPSIPNHPNCRCTWLLEVYEGWTPTQRRDNISKEVIDHVQYDEWKSNKGI